MFPGDALQPGNPGAKALDELAWRLVATTEHSTGNRWVPAGFTYLGQFIDHDITFDPTSKLGQSNVPTTLRNFRTPRFDLDSLYGTGPLDQPFLYDWDRKLPLRGVKLLMGRSARGGKSVADLPRNSQQRALIGDPRNDENIIVSQLQLLFIRFHNRVVDRVRDGDPQLPTEDVFDQAQQQVRWHYQWIVVHDFLERIVGTQMARSVLRPGVGGAKPTVQRKFYKWHGEPFMPVEFSGAAYRFGHSMVRDNYVLNDGTDAVSIFGPGRTSNSLRGRRKLPPDLEIEWKHFFDTTLTPPMNRSMRIDPFLAAPLRHVPPTGRALARLNLERGVALRLPAGPEVAAKLKGKPLTEEQLLAPLRGINEKRFGKAIVEKTPLWYYVLCESRSAAGLNGLRLGPVAGRIVAEVLVGLLQGDKTSYLHADPKSKPWTPELPSAQKGDFTMADLVRYAQEQTPL
jgi:Animal haem peroxidase